MENHGGIYPSTIATGSLLDSQYGYRYGVGQVEDHVINTQRDNAKRSHLNDVSDTIRSNQAADQLGSVRAEIDNKINNLSEKLSNCCCDNRVQGAILGEKVSGLKEEIAASAANTFERIKSFIQGEELGKLRLDNEFNSRGLFPVVHHHHDHHGHHGAVEKK